MILHSSKCINAAITYTQCQVKALWYSLLLKRRHAVIVDTANCKGPKLTSILLHYYWKPIIDFASTSEQITLTFMKICWKIIELWSLKNSIFSSSLPCLLLSTKECLKYFERKLPLFLEFKLTMKLKNRALF